MCSSEKRFGGFPVYKALLIKVQQGFFHCDHTAFGVSFYQRLDLMCFAVTYEGTHAGMGF
jgi:hypothetical protein